MEFVVKCDKCGNYSRHPEAGEYDMNQMDIMSKVLQRLAPWMTDEMLESEFKKFGFKIEEER